MLKLCPICQFHKPTKGTHRICADCRRVARIREQRESLPVPARTYLTKLIASGIPRARAFHIARAS